MNAAAQSSRNNFVNIAAVAGRENLDLFHFTKSIQSICAARLGLDLKDFFLRLSPLEIYYHTVPFTQYFLLLLQPRKKFTVPVRSFVQTRELELNISWESEKKVDSKSYLILCIDLFCTHSKRVEDQFLSLSSYE